MSWIPLAQRFAALPLILAGPILRRVEPRAVTVWLALKEPRRVTLRIYAPGEQEQLIEQFEGTRHTIRLGDHLHLVAVTAHATNDDELLNWGELYYYDLFFQPESQTGFHETSVPETPAHLETPGVLNVDPSKADPLHRLVYPGHSLPSFVLPPEEVNQLRVVHGSCRKPHGFGREMLSALDTLLEASASQRANRPQQLFLTGDQIYADDVAAPLLFALIDASHFLFTGNGEEVLPIGNTSARDLAPTGRANLVRNKAMFTTSTPHNHLLALNEYAAMYLFAWSDVLWPDALPDAEELWQVHPEVRPEPAQREGEVARYTANLESLYAFSAALPRARRALANIATYTICDDHDVTDDWYLDGAWCRQVLASSLGRRVIRNGLLAYALFQGWGNAPEQFAEQNGAALLHAIDAWRGDESDAGVKVIEGIIGLPASFHGSGQLQRSEQALSWHYTYCGPRYQVIVLDSRTQRFYRSPHEFPGLLSPDAMHTQIASIARAEAEVTLLVSATPVLGVDFVESIQFWSRWRIRENYAYDREAWALEWGTFQHLLKTVSAMKRVVFLSGDVHYAFGSSLQYWDQHTNTTAKLVDYTASPLRNEDAGSSIAVLAVGYPRLLHLLRPGGTPTMDFFAWDIAVGDKHILNAVLALIRERLYLFWWSIPRLIAAQRCPYEIVMPARGWLKGAFSAYPPDRVYRLQYLRNTLSRAVPAKKVSLLRRLSMWIIRPIRLALEGVTFIESRVGRIRGRLLRKASGIEHKPGLVPHPRRAIRQEAIRGTELIERQLEKRRNKLVTVIFHYASSLQHWKAGELIVGYNNISEVSFTWTPEQKEVTQRLWWCADDPEQPLQMTEYHDTLELPAADAAPPLP